MIAIIRHNVSVRENIRPNETNVPTTDKYLSAILLKYLLVTL